MENEEKTTYCMYEDGECPNKEYNAEFSSQECLKCVHNYDLNLLASIATNE